MQRNCFYHAAGNAGSDGWARLSRRLRHGTLPARRGPASHTPFAQLCMPLKDNSAPTIHLQHMISWTFCHSCTTSIEHPFSFCCMSRFITSDSNNGEDHIQVCSRANILMNVARGMCTLQMDREHCRSDPVQVRSTLWSKQTKN